MNTNRWKQSGRVHAWRYVDAPKKCSGLHLTADAEGIKSLLELIGFMMEAREESKRTIKLCETSENELRVPNFKSKALSCSKLILQNKKDNDTYWNISDSQGIVTIEAGDKALRKLIAGLLDIQRGQGDYSIGTKGHELWFWWHIKNK